MRVENSGARDSGPRSLETKGERGSCVRWLAARARSRQTAADSTRSRCGDDRRYASRNWAAQQIPRPLVARKGRKAAVVVIYIIL